MHWGLTTQTSPQRNNNWSLNCSFKMLWVRNWNTVHEFINFKEQSEAPPALRAHARRCACALVSVSQRPWLPGRIVKLITSWKNPKLNPKLESEHLPSAARRRSGLPVNNSAGGGETGTECPERSGWAFTESARKRKKKERKKKKTGVMREVQGFSRSPKNKILNLSIGVLKKRHQSFISQAQEH